MTGALRARELTAHGRGAVRVLELAGPAALERVGALAPRRELVPGALALVDLRSADGELLDQALVLVESPDCVELHVHGAPALVARLLQELGAAELGAAPELGVRLSIEERAEALLATATSEGAARVFLDQVEGALRRELEALLALTGDAFRARARALAERGRIARWLARPPRVVLAGPVNAGKSTLFNLLVGRERVVVDDRPGTTRDAVRERVQLGAYAVELFDTAGERALDGVHGEESAPGEEVARARIEQAGQALAAELRAAADVVLRLVPPWQADPPAAGPHERILHSQADRVDARARDGAGSAPAISALRAPGEARRRVEESVRAALDLPAHPHVPGAGVPFDPEWIDALARADARVLPGAVRAWLGRAPGAASD